jgi:two-component system KDP operon response regulator KdpE
VRRLVRVRGTEVKLTPREYDFLRVLIQHAGKALTHAQLMSAVSTSSDPQYLRVYMRQLRLKLEEDPERPRILLTETGVGYRLRAPEDEARA